MEPGEESFDDPPPLVAPQGAAILRGVHPIVSMRRDELNPKGRPEFRIQGIAVVGAVANQARRVRRDEAVVEGRADEPNFMW